ncbi:MAG: ribosomal RNA small subunit methyltransferase A, partial [Spirochaetes bacterium]|nr:ribosomal RNA small subunit methyltransferase A [Spirochaetota bacterium]
FAMQKKFGQNFLINQAARQRLFDLLQAEAASRCWEIGPGMGAMTGMAVDAGLSLSVFEIDHGFARYLQTVYGTVEGFRLQEGDFLQTWPRELAENGKPERIFGNLPYNAASAMIAALLENGLTPQRMVFTIQKEAAARMTARPGDKDYSAFTVLCQSMYDVRKAFDLGAAMFWPQPRVVSSVVIMTRNPSGPACAGNKDFTRFTRAAFASRRKTLRNNLKAIGIGEQQLMAASEKCGISPDLRAERLDAHMMAALFLALKQTTSA